MLFFFFYTIRVQCGQICMTAKKKVTLSSISGRLKTTGTLTFTSEKQIQTLKTYKAQQLNRKKQFRPSSQKAKEGKASRRPAPPPLAGHSSSASALLSSWPVSHLHSSTTRARLCWMWPPAQSRGTATVRALEGPQREQGALCRRWGGPADEADWASGGTNRELHWPKQRRLCTVTVLQPGAVTRCGEDTQQQGAPLVLGLTGLNVTVAALC